MNIKELESKIKYYSEMYYAGTPVIDDLTFDNLVDELRKLKADSEVLTTGWGFEVNGDKVKHKYSHIGSLDKTKTFDDIPDRFKSKLVYISPKLDGLSAVAYYKEGKLVQGITRGNGEYGKDITQKLSMILGPEIPDKTFTGAVRGELIINENNWKELQSKYKDLIAPRNFAAGIINRKEIDEDIKYIDLVVYKIVGQETTPFYNTRGQILQWLSNNFKHSIPIYYYPVMNEPAWNTYHEQTFEEFKKLGYGLDGLVLTNDVITYNNQTKGYMYDEVAFKFAAETADTEVQELEWTLSRTQRLVPVALVTAVELSGAIITRCTCNNAKMVQDLGLGQGAKVEITRSNEVIPQILKVYEESTQELPTHCPVCNSQLVWDGVDLKCNNEYCLNIDLSDLQQWCEVLGETDGLQWSLMKQGLDYYSINNINTLYEKRREVVNDLYNKILTITEGKILKFFKKLYEEPIPVDKAFLALNIPRVGDKTSQLLSKHLELSKKLVDYGSTMDTFSQDEIFNLKNELLNVVKTATTTELLDNRNLYKLQHLKLIQSRIEFNESVSIDDIKYVAVTGSLQTMKRKDFEKYISQYSYELSGNLKKCKYLITNNPDSGSSKNKQAQEYGIPIITEQDFLNTLN